MVQRLSRREAMGVAALAGILEACGSGAKIPNAVHLMGERVQAGAMFYSVMEADWHDQLGSGSSARVPQGKFCVIRLTITNSGNRETIVPLLHLENEKGESFLELSDAEGVEEWMGPLRPLNPAETLQGRILFDVKPANYLLRVTDGGEPDREKTAQVAIQFKIKESGPLAAPTGDK